MKEERARTMTFSLYPSTKERLAEYKKKQKGNLSFDEAINKLLDLAEGKGTKAND